MSGVGRKVKTWVFRSEVDGTHIMIPLAPDSTNRNAEERLGFFVKNPKSFKLEEVLPEWPSTLYARGRTSEKKEAE